MSWKRNNGGDWVSTSNAAIWLGQSNALVRTFIFHLRDLRKLTGAWDYDSNCTPKLMLDRQFIYDNWDEWAEAWDHWYSPRHGQ
ncbi:hypothetical protein [Streptomyces thermodiastaticus]|uniref:hypothetical protein n=1 Tax=Streptomyces thermodiastaticus TaxID=44061 RepID=UPI001674563C|nr:hypothetical protein [Streptomyces thermodiastaticus]MCE7552768.1 hypothetical protein [Streptomyces thermodiastaticus]GHF89051.1 hypothetical protein GCM10018787_42170 [Streptomyces thermodiastaticus]